MRFPSLASIVATLLVTGTGSAGATPIVVNSGVFCCTDGGEGSGRGQGIQATSPFSISSLGIFGDLPLLSFEVVIYASTTGSDVGAVLGSSSAVVGGTGNGWNDIPINFSFTAGSYYVVNWRPTVNDNNNWATTLDYYRDSGLPVTVGPITLVEGFEGFGPGPDNELQPSFRYDIVSTVPEPASLSLLGFGLAGLGARRWRQRRNT